MTDTAFEGWAIVEIMGHRVRPGKIREIEIAGGKMLQVDIPTSADDFVSEFYGIQSLYSIRPCTEEIARDQAGYSHRDPRPIRPVDYRPAPAIDHTDPEDDMSF